MNMNLSTEQKDPVIQREAATAWGLKIVTLVFILTVLATGGAILWKNILQGKVVAADDEYKASYDKLIQKERSKDIVDFQNRIALSKIMINEKNVVFDSLQLIEKHLVPGAYLNVYKNDKNKKAISLSGVAENYEILAKQTLSFKQSGIFSSVDVSESKLSPDGRYEFSMELKIQ